MTKVANAKPSYVVLRQVRDNQFELVGEVVRRPGQPAKVSRGSAVLDAAGREPAEGEVYVVLPRSEWQLGFEW